MGILSDEFPPKYYWTDMARDPINVVTCAALDRRPAFLFTMLSQ
jgi:hypothetical protein